MIIIPNITTLSQYLKMLETEVDQYQPSGCPSCRCPCCNKHGFYYRKTSRDKTFDDADNPIPIQRFLCKDCRCTFSCLPECIPPRRWYSWAVQESALSRLLDKKNFQQAALAIVPGRTTLSRWWEKWCGDHAVYADHLKTKHPDLGRQPDFVSFWKKCLSQFSSLAKVMRFLYNLGAPVPSSS